MTEISTQSDRISMRGGFSVGAKINAVVVFCLLMLAVVAGTGIWQMSIINTEIEGIAERDVPLTEKLTNITVHQLEQAINFERAIGYSKDMRNDPDAAVGFKNSIKHFEELADQVDREVREGRALVVMAIRTAATDEERAEFKHLGAELEKIEHEHQGYNDSAMEIFRAMAAGNLVDLRDKIKKAGAEEEHLDHALEKLLAEIGKFTQNAAKTAEEHEHFAVRLMSVISIVSLIFGIGFSQLIVRRSIARPLRDVIRALKALTAGDTNVEIAARADDEIGAVAKALAIFRENMVENQRLQTEQQESDRRNLEQQAQREQEKLEAETKATEEKLQQEERAKAERRQAMLDLADNFEQSVSGVIQSVSAAADEMQSSAQAMSTTADQTSQQATAVAAASEEASANVQTVASAAEELSASVQEISRQVSQSSTIANNAVDEAQRTNQRIQALAEASQKIGDVVSLINDIASQTNLLALNATIEAARAGEAGKGFAVVATEVKSLADQTAKATEEIATQISAIQGSTTDAVEAIQGIGSTIAEINDIASSIAAAVEEQGASTNEIAQNVAQAASGTQEVSSNIAGVTQAASETGSAAGQVLSAAGELAQQSNVLRQTVDEFVQQVRAA